MSSADRVVVIGYASLDHKYATEAFRGPGRTTLVRTPLGEGRPQPGAVAYFATALAARGCPVSVVSWVGDDDLGLVFDDHLRRSGVDVSVLAHNGARSPSSHLFYEAGGDCVVWFDPGDVDLSLTPAQRAKVAEASAVLIGIGPIQATHEALDALSPDAVLLWAVKADPGSLDPPLARRLLQRAQVVCLSRSETAFVAEATGIDLSCPPDVCPVVVVTDGSAGVRVLGSGTVHDLRVEDPLQVEDATGAGDTFAAGVLARTLRALSARDVDVDLVRDAVVGACADAHHLLLTRLAKG